MWHLLKKNVERLGSNPEKSRELRQLSTTDSVTVQIKFS